MSSTEPASLIPATLLTGFLGSGKTTVLNHVLKRVVPVAQHLLGERLLIHPVELPTDLRSHAQPKLSAQEAVLGGLHHVYHLAA